MRQKPDLTTILFLATSLVSTCLLAYVPHQSEFWLIGAFFMPFFLVYLFTFWKNERLLLPFHFWQFWGIALRLIVLFSIPNLSDDFYRFIWDGRIWQSGQNPFDHLPGYFLEEQNRLPGLDAGLFSRLNSPAYFTIYPPVCQFFFALSGWFGGGIYPPLIFLKIVVVSFEVATIFLFPKVLKLYGAKPERSLLYVLNPLIIIEISGNLHFDGVMIFFLLAALFMLKKGKIFATAVLFSLSVATKLIPLIFLLFLPRRLGFMQSFRFFSVLGIMLALLFLPIFSGVFLKNFGDSLDLYFRKFEFNASVYYLLRWLGFQWKGYNLIAVIGPFLAICTFGLIAGRAFFEKIKSDALNNLPFSMLFAATAFLFFTTTVHPWYVTLPLALCLFTNYRFPVLWSGLAILSYAAYSQTPFRENLWLTAFEYSAVFGFLIWEIMREHRAAVQTSLGDIPK